MKKLLLFVMCFLILGGCEKKVEVIQKEEGFEIEKIAAIPFKEKDGHREVFYENQMINIIDWYFDSNAHETKRIKYEMNVNTNEIEISEIFEESEVQPEYNEEYFESKHNIILKDTSNYKIVLEQTTILVKGKVEKTIVKFNYITNQKNITFYEEERRPSDDIRTKTNYAGYYGDEKLGNLLIYCKNDEIFVSKIKEGKLEQIDKFAIDDGNYQLTYLTVIDGEYHMIYESEQTRKEIIGDEIYELKNDEALTQIMKDYVLISKLSNLGDEVNVIQTKLIERDTHKEFVLSKPIETNYYGSDYDSNRVFTFVDGKHTIMDINTNSILQRMLPFESTFEFVRTNENQYIFYDLNQPDFYKVTLK